VPAVHKQQLCLSAQSHCLLHALQSQGKRGQQRQLREINSRRAFGFKVLKDVQATLQSSMHAPITKHEQQALIVYAALHYQSAWESLMAGP